MTCTLNSTEIVLGFSLAGGDCECGSICSSKTALRPGAGEWESPACSTGKGPGEQKVGWERQAVCTPGGPRTFSFLQWGATEDI